jgi:hypothetical protein
MDEILEKFTDDNILLAIKIALYNSIFDFSSELLEFFFLKDIAYVKFI